VDALTLSRHQLMLREACDCSQLYFVRDLFPMLLETLGAAPIRCQRIPHILAAFADAAPMLASAVHLPPVTATTASAGGVPSTADTHRVTTRTEAEAMEAALAKDPRENLLSAFDGFLRRHIHEQLVLPLCREIEVDVRVHVHSVLLSHMSAPSPKDTEAKSTGILPKPASWLLSLPPLRLIVSEVSIRSEVESYLEAQFFDQTAMSLHDWRTYGEMAALASMKYGLAISDYRLPMGSAETATSDLDVLQIMRAIHVFVRRFSYSLHDQVSVRVHVHVRYLTVLVADLCGAQGRKWLQTPQRRDCGQHSRQRHAAWHRHAEHHGELCVSVPQQAMLPKGRGLSQR
jgi:WASH complex subunit 7